MTLTPTQQRDLIARESAWIDVGQFAPLDLSSLPALNELPPEKARDDLREPSGAAWQMTMPRRQVKK